MASTQPIKVLLGKLGLDGHDRGVKVIARGLRDHGMEVIYLGMRLTPEQVAEAALQEDVEVVGISILSGAHMRLLPKLVRGLRDRGMDDVLVLAGGTIPESDVEGLEEAGVHGVFRQGASVDDIAELIRSMLERVAAP
ncbi:cobalamin B12-binding domain-containing protein [soil metagenome]